MAEELHSIHNTKEKATGLKGMPAFGIDTWMLRLARDIAQLHSSTAMISVGGELNLCGHVGG